MEVDVIQEVDAATFESMDLRNLESPRAASGKEEHPAVQVLDLFPESSVRAEFLHLEHLEQHRARVADADAGDGGGGGVCGHVVAHHHEELVPGHDEVAGHVGGLAEVGHHGLDPHRHEERSMADLDAAVGEIRFRRRRDREHRHQLTGGERVEPSLEEDHVVDRAGEHLHPRPHVALARASHAAEGEVGGAADERRGEAARRVRRRRQGHGADDRHGRGLPGARHLAHHPAGERHRLAGVDVGDEVLAAHGERGGEPAAGVGAEEAGAAEARGEGDPAGEARDEAGDGGPLDGRRGEQPRDMPPRRRRRRLVGLRVGELAGGSPVAAGGGEGDAVGEAVDVGEHDEEYLGREAVGPGDQRGSHRRRR